MKCFSPPAQPLGISLLDWEFSQLGLHVMHCHTKQMLGKKAAVNMLASLPRARGLELSHLQDPFQPKAFYGSMIYNVVKNFMARLVWRRNVITHNYSQLFTLSPALPHLPLPSAFPGEGPDFPALLV